jgi:hypothetical protein
MTRIIDIPNDRWTSFVETISRLADGRAVRLEVANRELGDQDMAELQPLIGIDFDTKGSERGAVVVSVGSDRGELTHVVAKPTRIAVAINEVSEPQSVAIEDADGGTTIVHFERMPALPDEPTVSAA